MGEETNSFSEEFVIIFSYYKTLPPGGGAASSSCQVWAVLSDWLPKHRV